MKKNEKIQRKVSVVPVKITFLLVMMLYFLPTILYGQQSPMYSQYMFNMLTVNPAYAGHRAVNNINVLYRNQWVGFEGSPQTTSISWDKRQENSNVGYGIQLYDDRLGIESTTGFQALYSYRLVLENSTFTFGLSAGMLNFKASYDEASPLDLGDPAFAMAESAWLPTVGFGVLFSKEKWYAGFSIPALLKTKTFYNDPTRSDNALGANHHYFLTGGYIFEVSDELKIKPSVLFKAVSEFPTQVDLNINVWLKNTIGLGISYRTDDALVGIAEFQITPQIRVGYAYDYSLSVLNRFNQGTHELMLRYEFDSGKVLDLLSPRYY